MLVRLSHLILEKLFVLRNSIFTFPFVCCVTSHLFSTVLYVVSNHKTLNGSYDMNTRRAHVVCYSMLLCLCYCLWTCMLLFFEVYLWKQYVTVCYCVCVIVCGCVCYCFLKFICGSRAAAYWKTYLQLHPLSSLSEKCSIRKENVLFDIAK